MIKRVMRGALRLLGRAGQVVTIAIMTVAIVGGIRAVANYNATVPGSGTSFAGVAIGGVQYAAQLICDATLGTAQCAAVSATGNLQVDTPSSSSNLYTAITSPPNVNVNGSNTALTGLTPGTPQTGTIVAPNTDLSSVAGIALGAMANYGTSPGAVKVQGVNAFVTNPVTVVTGAADPCQAIAHTYTPINYSASGLNTTPIIAGVSNKKTYICHIILQNNALDAVGIIETTTATSCATDVRALWGGATHSSAAAGFNLSANSGVALGNGGYAVAQTSTNNDDVCFIQSAATQLTGGVEWVQQ